MDFEFRYNEQGLPVAEFSMGHEAIGRWLSDELGSNLAKINLLLEVIEQIEQAHLAEKTLFGTELTLYLSSDDVEVKSIYGDDEEDLPEETHLSDSSSTANCGLPDFKQAVEEWLDYHS
ncbi:YacL family protein [Reinekea forsetii]|nr:YacL family protein [Reinekea forsetii]